MKKIGEVVVYVSFDFGGGAYVTVTLYEGKTFEECIRLRSEHIDGYIESGIYINLQFISPARGQNRAKEAKMTRNELIEALEQVKDKIADGDELTEYARYRAYISVEDAIQHLIENYDTDD